MPGRPTPEQASSQSTRCQSSSSVRKEASMSKRSTALGCHLLDVFQKICANHLLTRQPQQLQASREIPTCVSCADMRAPASICRVEAYA